MGWHQILATNCGPRLHSLFSGFQKWTYLVGSRATSHLRTLLHFSPNSDVSGQRSLTLTHFLFFFLECLKKIVLTQYFLMNCFPENCPIIFAKKIPTHLTYDFLIFSRGLLYRGMIDCLQQSVKNEGILSLYKGFLPLWMRLGPWALINWIAFENIMLSLGGKTF